MDQLMEDIDPHNALSLPHNEVAVAVQPLSFDRVVQHADATSTSSQQPVIPHHPLDDNSGHTNSSNTKTCAAPGCKTRPTYGMPGKKQGYCAQHKLVEMVDVCSKICEEEFCTRRAVYGLPGEGARFCGLHKTAVMENVYHSRCAQPGCDGLSPSYGFDDGSVPEGGAADKRRFCQAHKQAGMKDMRTGVCEDPSCHKVSSYGFAAEAMRRLCGEHRMEGMVDLYNKRCRAEGCQKQPCHAFPGQPPCCCKLAGMIDVRSKRCEGELCKKNPSFGFKGKRAMRCKEHMLEGMVAVQGRRCQGEGCLKRASFGLPNSRPSRCIQHREEGMLNVRSRTCQAPECNRQPCFAPPGCTLATSCSQHKSNTDIDVRHPHCDFVSEGDVAVGGGVRCTRLSSFAAPGKRQQRCAQHKVLGMVDVVNNSAKKRRSRPGRADAAAATATTASPIISKYTKVVNHDNPNINIRPALHVPGVVSALNLGMNNDAGSGGAARGRPGSTSTSTSLRCHSETSAEICAGGGVGAASATASISTSVAAAAAGPSRGFEYIYGSFAGSPPVQVMAVPLAPVPLAPMAGMGYTEGGISCYSNGDHARMRMAGQEQEQEQERDDGEEMEVEVEVDPSLIPVPELHVRATKNSRPNSAGIAATAADKRAQTPETPVGPRSSALLSSSGVAPFSLPPAPGHGVQTMTTTSGDFSAPMAPVALSQQQQQQQQQLSPPPPSPSGCLAVQQLSESDDRPRREQEKQQPQQQGAAMGSPDDPVEEANNATTEFITSDDLKKLLGQHQHQQQQGHQQRPNSTRLNTNTSCEPCGTLDSLEIRVVGVKCKCCGKERWLSLDDTGGECTFSASSPPLKPPFLHVDHPSGDQHHHRRHRADVDNHEEDQCQGQHQQGQHFLPSDRMAMAPIFEPSSSPEDNLRQDNYNPNSPDNRPSHFHQQHRHGRRQHESAVSNGGGDGGAEGEGAGVGAGAGLLVDGISPASTSPLHAAAIDMQNNGFPHADGGGGGGGATRAEAAEVGPRQFPLSGSVISGSADGNLAARHVAGAMSMQGNSGDTSCSRDGGGARERREGDSDAFSAGVGAQQRAFGPHFHGAGQVSGAVGGGRGLKGGRTGSEGGGGGGHDDRFDCQTCRSGNDDNDSAAVPAEMAAAVDGTRSGHDLRDRGTLAEPGCRGTGGGGGGVGEGGSRQHNAPRHFFGSPDEEMLDAAGPGLLDTIDLRVAQGKLSGGAGEGHSLRATRAEEEERGGLDYVAANGIVSGDGGGDEEEGGDGRVNDRTEHNRDRHDAMPSEQHHSCSPRNHSPQQPQHHDHLDDSHILEQLGASTAAYGVDNSGGGGGNNGPQPSDALGPRRHAVVPPSADRHGARPLFHRQYLQ